MAYQFKKTTFFILAGVIVGLSQQADLKNQEKVFDIDESDDRDLKQLFTSSSNNKCNTDCLDNNFHWCSNESMSKGKCCDNQSCSSSLGSNPICSYETNQSILKRFTCPQPSTQCGSDKMLIPPADGSALTLKPGDSYFREFQEGSACSYQIKFPSVAGPTDTIRFIIDQEVRTRAYAIIGSSFYETSSKVTTLDKNDIISVTYPDTIFLILISDDSSTAGYFSLRYKFIDKNPTAAEIAAAEAKAAGTPITERVVIFEDTIVETENEFIGSINFYIVCGIALIVVFVILFTGVHLTRVNQKNKEMMSKIQTLSQSVVVDGKIVSKTEATELSKRAKPSSKPTIDQGDQHDFIKAQVGAIFKNSQQQQEFNTMFEDFVKKQKQNKNDQSLTNDGSDSSFLLNQKKNSNIVHPLDQSSTHLNNSNVNAYETATSVKTFKPNSESRNPQQTFVVAEVQQVQTTPMGKPNKTKLHNTMTSIDQNVMATVDSNQFVSIQTQQQPQDAQKSSLPPIKASNLPSIGLGNNGRGHVMSMNIQDIDILDPGQNNGPL